MIRAMLWDVDGTLSETERDGHLVAFNQAFEALRIPWRWSDARYAELLAVAGGRERLLYDMRSQSQAPGDHEEREALAERVHGLKNRLYADIVTRGELPLRSGVRELLQDCASAAVRLGIVTTTSRANVEALLGTHLGADWQSIFDVVISAEEAPKKKPDPQAYRLALEALQLRPHDTVAMEDAPAGVAAARAMGVPVLVTRSHYFSSIPGQGALAAGPSLSRIEGWNPPADPRATRIDLAQIIRWHARSTVACD
ncbi:MAG: HAD-IA family hydrolase [Gammaproteobacteria bacterium]